LALFNENIEKIKSANMKNLGVEIFVSNKSHSIAPYLTEKKLIHMLDSAFCFADSVNIDLSRLNSILAFKYNTPEKLETFLQKIKSTSFRSLGLKATYEYEYFNCLNNSNKSVTKNIQPITKILQKQKTNVFLRLDENSPQEYLEMALSLIVKSGIVDALIIDSFSKNDENLDPENSHSNKKIREIRKIIGKDFPIISCGGILKGEDVFYRIKSGADFVLLDDAFKQRGPYCLEKITRELSDKMQKNNYFKIKQLRTKE